MCVVGVEVGQQDDVGVGGVPGRNLPPHSTEVAHPSGQNWVEEEGCAAVLPGDGAVPPPGHGAGHGVLTARNPRTAAAPSSIPAMTAVRNVDGAHLDRSGRGGETLTSVLPMRAATCDTSRSL